MMSDPKTTDEPMPSVDDVLRRMLATPPQPKKTKPAKAKKKPAKK